MHQVDVHLVIILFLLIIYRWKASDMTDMNPDDSASFSRPDECRVTSLHLNLDVDFVSRTLCGFVDLAVKRMKDGVHNLVRQNT